MNKQLKEKEYKWHKENDIIVCVVGGKNSIEQFKNYARMIVEMEKSGWKPYGWKLKELNF